MTRCFVCEQEIEPGESREATTDTAGRAVTRHSDCGVVENRPPGLLSILEPTDAFQITFDGGETWHYATVEGYGMVGGEFVMRCVLQNVRYAEGHIADPFLYTDQFDIITAPERDGWADPVAHEIEPDDEKMEESDGNDFYHIHHEMGPVELRPTDLTDGPYDWEFWNERPTDPVDLYERYVVEVQTTVEIAEALGVSDWTVRKWMDRAGIERRDSATEASA